MDIVDAKSLIESEGKYIYVTYNTSDDTGTRSRFACFVVTDDGAC